MTLFANIQNDMSGEAAEKLFAAGVSFLGNKAFSAA